MEQARRFAAIQLDTVVMEVNFNVHKALHWTRRAFEGGATHVFLHEELTADCTPDPVRYGRPLDSHEVYGFSRLAGRYHGYVALGLNEVFEGRPYISCVYLGGQGVEGVYRKSYLWPHEYSGQGMEAAFRQTAVPSDEKIRPLLNGEWAQHRQGYRQERGIIAPGDGTKNVPVGDLVIGTLICADSHHPASWQTFERDVPDMIFYQSNSGAGCGPWLPALSMIARELCVPIVAVNRVGFSHAAWMQGGSFMLDDDGTVVARANEDGEEEIISADWAALTPRRAARTQAAVAAVPAAAV